MVVIFFRFYERLTMMRVARREIRSRRGSRISSGAPRSGCGARSRRGTFTAMATAAEVADEVRLSNLFRIGAIRRGAVVMHCATCQDVCRGGRRRRPMGIISLESEDGLLDLVAEDERAIERHGIARFG